MEACQESRKNIGKKIKRIHIDDDLCFILSLTSLADTLEPLKRRYINLNLISLESLGSKKGIELQMKKNSYDAIYQNIKSLKDWMEVEVTIKEIESDMATYKMLINICFLVVKGLLLTDEKGDLKMSKYLDDRKMHNLYEKFILEYYRKHYPEFKATPSQVDWNVDDGFLELLPAMKSDITLEYQGRTTIIDAKYYSRMLQYNQLFNSKTLHSNNMYQIFIYVKNKDVKQDGSVSGVLLYAKTEEEEMLDQSY